MNIFNNIDKKKQIEKWIQWSPVPIEIIKPSWGEHKPKGEFNPNKQIIIINGNQNDKEIIKSIIHEICHQINNHKVNDHDIWEKEEHCQQVEKQWKKEPEEINWKP